MLIVDEQLRKFIGPHGSLDIAENDEITRKLSMLIEGECGALGPSKAAEKFGYSKQRYYQLLHRFLEQGAIGLQSQPRGPKRNYRRTPQVGREVIRYRFLNPDASAEVIAQKLRQTGFPISTRSVHRVIAEYGLQKKTPHLSPHSEPRASADSAHQAAPEG
jgi:transposase